MKRQYQESLALALRFAAAVALTLAFGCSDDKPTGPKTPSIDLTLTPPAGSTTLGTTQQFFVRVKSNNFTGPVAISASNVPSTWQISDFASNDTLNLLSGASGGFYVTLTIPSNGEAAPTGTNVAFSATGASVSDNANYTATVANEYILPIANGTGSGSHWPEFQGQTLYLRAGAGLTIRNDDTVGHRIHTDGDIIGFPHQDATMGPGGTFTNTPTGTGATTIYCHDHLIASGSVSMIFQ